MYNFDRVFLIIYFSHTLCYIFVNSGWVRWRADSGQDEDSLPDDHYTFVALIDFVFTNGTKKICTGTIIHDNVVITAAHCFKADENSQPDITLSFVVIGTQKMFETGYEQYLPIEKILIHPDWDGWAADLALVYTFADMMSNKPGQVVPLVSEKSSAVDSSVFVFSWGRLTADEVTKTTTSNEIDTEATQATSVADSEYIIEDDNEITDINVLPRTELYRVRPKTNRKKKGKNNKLKHVPKTTAPIYNKEVLISSKFNRDVEEKNRYQYNQKRHFRVSDFNSNAEKQSWEQKLGNLDKLYQRSEVNRYRMYQKNRRRFRRRMPYYRKGVGRQIINNQENKLTVDMFGFVNTQVCQKCIKKAKPSLYRMRRPQDFLCYTSERHYITEDDVGAPAMRRGQLVAVTLGSVANEGEHVAVGIKMMCFCNWIAANLPRGDKKIVCCTNCCDDHNVEENDNKNITYRHRHKKIY